MTQDIKFYLSLFLRKLHWFALFVIVGAVAGAYYAFSLPTTYRAQAVLVVESPQISDDLAASTVLTSAVEMLEVIRQRITTPDNLLDLAERFDVFSDTPEMPRDARVNLMRTRLLMELPNAMIDRATIVRVSFDAPDAETTANITNAVVDQILEQNTEMRLSVAGQTLQFFRNEVERLDIELAAQGDRILTFKEANQNSLPENLDYQRTRQTTLQERLLQTEREIANLQDRRARLVEIFERTGRTDILGENMTPEQRQLQQLRDQLASALVIYSPENPRVASLRAQVAALEAANIRQGLGTQDTPNMTTFELQAADIDGQIEFLEEQAALLEQELETISVNIEATPGNAIVLGSLERDYENIRLQYSQATASLANARTGDQIEAESRGQRVTVTERATIPSEPASPNRRLIIAAGIAIGFGAGLAFLFLLEVMNRAIRRPSELTAQLGITPFGSVPYITTQYEVTRRRRIAMASVLLLIFAAGGGLYAALNNPTTSDMLQDRMTQLLRQEG